MLPKITTSINRSIKPSKFVLGDLEKLKKEQKISELQKIQKNQKKKDLALAYSAKPDKLKSKNIDYYNSTSKTAYGGFVGFNKKRQDSVEKSSAESEERNKFLSFSDQR